MQMPQAEGLNYQDAAEYAIAGLELIGTPLTYIDLVTVPPLRIVNHKAALPTNMISIRGVRYLDGNGEGVAMRKATDVYHQSIPTTGNINTTGSEIITSPFDATNQGVNVDQTATAGTTNTATEFTYTAQAGVIQTSIPDGEIEVAYQSLAVDCDDYPMIPDNIQVKECIRYYILHRFLEPLFMMGKVTDKVFNYIDQKKCFYMGSANTSMQLQGTDHLESVMNAVNRLIINDKAFSNFYKKSGQQERIKKYR